MTKAYINFELTDLFPLHCHYDGQINPQKAYISLDLRDGEVTADYDGEIGGGIPSDVFNGHVLRWEIRDEFTADEIYSILEENLEYFQYILDKAEDSTEGLDCLDDNKFLNYVPAGGIHDFDYFDFFNIGENETVEQFIDKFYEMDGEDGYYFKFRKSTRDDVKEMILEQWYDALGAGDELSPKIAQYLLDDGRYNDNWAEELKEMAEQQGK